ncbi:MAG: hypothetical protein ABI969_00050 [bacterium]
MTAPLEQPAPPNGTLYFASNTAAPVDAPRMLVVSYHFPPDPVVGGLRWQEMARFFISLGWAVDVISRDFRDVEHLDPARLEHFSANLRLFSVADREPLVERAHKIAWPRISRLLARESVQRVDALTHHEVKKQSGGGRGIVRAYFAWLEYARGGNWARAAAKLGVALARMHRYQFVVSSSPPHLAHEASRLISRASGLPFVMDMRDPWSLQERLPESIASPLWFRLARRHEARCVHAASLITMNTEHVGAMMRRTYPESASRIEIVRNGADSDPLPDPTRDGRFSIRFAGSIYSDRDPRLVFRASARVVRDLGLTPEQFVVELAGDMDGEWVSEIAEEEGIAAYVSLRGLLSRKDVLEFQAGATVLLSLPLAQDRDTSLPAKIYEYVRFAAWLLVVAHPESALADLLRGSEADVVGPQDVDGITLLIRHRYEQFSAGERPLPVGRDGQFDRSVQARKFLMLVQRTQKERTATTG